jgi:foldase protein PrsA
MNARLFDARLLTAMALVAVLAAGCGGGGNTVEPTAADVATVGSIHLSKTRFQDELSRARTTLKAQGQAFPKEGTTEYESLKAEAIWLLVQGAARELEAEKLGIDVTAKDVNKRIGSITKDYFGGSRSKYEAELKKEGLTDAEARNLIKGLLISEQLTTEVTKDLKVSDEDVHKQFIANRSQYPDEREVQYILVGKGKEQLAQQIYEKLKGGAAFAALAKQYSQDPSSKDKGGKLTAKRGQLVPNFDKVAFALKNGELAKPVNTPEYGWFVIKALSPVKKTSEKSVAETIRLQLLDEKKNQAMTDWASGLAKRFCTGGKISYQVGYTPNPDPCTQFTSTTTSTGSTP